MSTVIGYKRGVTHNQPHARGRNVQFFSRCLGQSRSNALAALHFAGQYCDGTIFAHVQAR